MRNHSGTRLFTLWFGFYFPLVAMGTLIIAFATHLYLGLLTLLLAVAWISETALTTCRRCAFYGTARCGLPGLLVPMLLKRASPESISPARIKAHYYTDVFVLLYMNAIYCLDLSFLPAMLIWSLGAWNIVLGPKRYHGLLHRLKKPEHHPSQQLHGIHVVIDTASAPRPSCQRCKKASREMDIH